MNLYNDIQNVQLRTWNRCATAWNLFKDNGSDKMKKYLSELSLEDRKLCSEMFSRIKTEGYERVRSSISRGVQNEG